MNEARCVRETVLGIVSGRALAAAIQLPNLSLKTGRLTEMIKIYNLLNDAIEQEEAMAKMDEPVKIPNLILVMMTK